MSLRRLGSCSDGRMLFGFDFGIKAGKESAGSVLQTSDSESSAITKPWKSSKLSFKSSRLRARFSVFWENVLSNLSCGMLDSEIRGFFSFLHWVLFVLLSSRFVSVAYLSFLDFWRDDGSISKQGSKTGNGPWKIRPLHARTGRSPWEALSWLPKAELDPAPPADQRMSDSLPHRAEADQSVVSEPKVWSE